MFKLLGMTMLALVAMNATARPRVVYESAVISTPEPTAYRFASQVAIDGDFVALRVERRYELEEYGTIHDSAVFLYRRNGASWSLVRQLTPYVEIDEWTAPGLAMNNGIAAVVTNGTSIFELANGEWTQSPGPRRTNGGDIAISGPRILFPALSVNWDGYIYEKNAAGTWASTATLPGHPSMNTDNAIWSSLDLSGDGAVISNPMTENEPREGPLALVYRRGPSGWAMESEILWPAASDDVVAIRGRDVYLGTTAPGGAFVYRRTAPRVYEPAGRLQTIGAYQNSTGDIVQDGDLVLQYAQYSIGYEGKVDVFRERADGSYEHVAILSARDGTSLNGSMAISGNRVVVNSTARGGANVARIFDLPTSFAVGAVLNEDFQTGNAGNWAPIAGSQFSLVTTAGQRVYRQSSTAGDAASFLTTSNGADQSIEADITLRAVNGNNRWAGLATRQTDWNNYYYVTLRHGSEYIELKRKVNGLITVLGSARLTPILGRAYNIRLASQGQEHQLWVNGVQVLGAYDAALSQGRVGVLTNRASADFDNVIVSPTVSSTVFESTFDRPVSGVFTHTGTGNWNVVDVSDVFAQTSTTGEARAITGIPTEDQVVQTMIRPTTYGTGTAWVGMILRYVDDSNYVYITMRPNNVLSLRQLVNGQIQVLAEAPVTVTPQTWHKLRAVLVSGKLRVYFNDEQKLAVNSLAHASGRVGLMTNRAAAEFDDFTAYLP